ncbi:MAG: hypothetical protein WCO00_14770 [Rhodospirillaceae bacterium]
MRIGLDFDNTIVSYDRLFHKVAVEGGHVPVDLPVSKLAVRDYLRGIGREPVWTEMQGYVYGARLLEAEAFEGVAGFLAWARQEGLFVAIVSHKTRHPFIGPPDDLHAMARAWIERHLADTAGPLITNQRVHFELTKEEKLARIAAGAFDCFVDDLPEILTASAFPENTAPVLFDPDGRGHAGIGACVTSWANLRALVEARWRHRS